MHDLNGKPITPFCRVRAATKEELAEKGVPDYLAASLSPAEQFALPGQYQSDTCNVYVTAEPAFSPSQPTPGGLVELKITCGVAWPTLCSAKALVRVD